MNAKLVKDWSLEQQVMYDKWILAFIEIKLEEICQCNICSLSRNIHEFEYIMKMVYWFSRNNKYETSNIL